MDPWSFCLFKARSLLLIVLFGSFSVLSLLLWASPVAADGPPLNGVGGTTIVYDPHDGYVYMLNSNDTVSVVDGTRVVHTIDLPTGSYGRLTDLAVAPNGDVYVSQWFYDRVFVLRNGQIYATIPRQNDTWPGENGIANGPVVVAANPVNNLMYVATGWVDAPTRNGVDVLSGTQVITFALTGLYPQAIGIMPGTGQVYVANALSDTVTVLSGTTIVRQIPVGAYPTALGVDGNRRLVYIVNRNSATISVIDEATLAVTATLSVGNGPMAIYVDPAANWAYVVNSNSDSVTIIDGQSLTPIVTLPVEHNPLAVAGGNGMVYVANQMSNTVTIIQGTGVTATLAVGRSPVALAWDPGDGLYVVNYQSATLSLITGTSVIATIGGLPRLSHTSIESLPNGHAVVADLTGLQTWFLSGANVVTTVETLDYPSYPLYDTPARGSTYDYLKVARKSVAVDEQGRVFVSNHQGETVSVITESEGRQQVVWMYGQPFNLEVMPSPGSGRVYAAVGNGVVVFNPGLTSTVFLTSNLAGARALAAWPEQDRMYVARPWSAASQVSIIRDSDLSVTDVIPVCGDPFAIAIDRARNLVYVTCSDSRSNSVGVISGTTWLGQVPVGQFPQNVVFNPINSYVYATALLGNQVAVLSGTTRLATIPVPGLPFAVDVDPATGYVYVTCETGNVVAVITGTTLLTTIPTGDFPDAIRVLTETIYVGNAHSANADVFKFKEVPPDQGNDWVQASAIVSNTVYAAPLQSEEDVDWYKIHLSEPGSIVTITLGGLPADYDLALFNPLTETQTTSSTIETLDLGQVLADGRLQSLGGSVDLGQLRSIYRGGGRRIMSNNNLLSPEVLSDKIWEGGDYYIAVWGHNGAYSAQPYTLRAEVAPPTQPITPALPITPTSVSLAADSNVRALIVTNAQRLQDRYGITRTAALTTTLVTLTQAISGTIIYLEDYTDTAASYTQWDSLPENSLAANIVADTLKHKLEILLTQYYTNAEYIVLVGNDNIIPFRRVPDLTLIANERSYNAWVQGSRPMAARIRGGYILSDDFYASYHALPGRGHDLYLPEYATGRLVETPEEMIAAVEAYLTLGPASTLTVTRALVGGYDFLIDEATAISNTLGPHGVTVTHIISDAWTADDLRPPLLTSTHELISLNGHFNHQLMVAADGRTYITQSEIVSAATSYADDLIFSVGCQGGLNVPDEDALSGEESWTLDFAQAFVQRGAVYIANTGYGYGDSNAIGYSEILALKLSQQLANGPVPVGKALMQAKQQYYADVGYASFGDYDEKALVESTLYGLPMLKMKLPQGSIMMFNQKSVRQQIGSVASTASGIYATLPITLTPTFALITATRDIGGSPTVIGNYYQADGDVQVSPGRPLQPRTSVDLRALLSQDQAIHGALFTGGRYTTIENFDPVVSRIVSDTAAAEPPFTLERWYPSPMHVINRLQLGQRAVSEKLVVMPAQYLAATEITGTERLYGELNFAIHSATTGATDDFIPPSTWRVEAITTAQTVSFTVVVTDPSGIDRVVVAYDTGAGEWRTFDLVHLAGDYWGGSGPSIMTQAFVQAVDKAGNVAFSDNKGVYFTAIGLSLSSSQAGKAKPGESIVYTHALTNTGGGMETFIVGTAYSPSWLVQQSSTVIRLMPGISEMIFVTVNVPTGMLSGTQTIVTMTTTSLSDQRVSAVVTDTTTVMQAASVALAPNQEGRAVPGEILTYTHILTNTGNGQDTFVLYITGGHQISPPNVSLGPGESATITATIRVPCVLGGTRVDAVMTARSVSDYWAAYATATDSTTVSQTVGVALSPGLTAGAASGGIATFAHTITNSGNYTDVFDISANSAQGWSVSAPATMTVAPCHAVDVSLGVSVPVTAIGYLTDIITFAVTSNSEQMGSAVIIATSAVVTDITIVSRTVGVVLSPGVSLNARPRQNVTFAHTVTNSGNYTDVFDISVYSAEGLTISAPVSVTIGPWSALDLAFTVTTPATTTDFCNSITVTAFSSFDPPTVSRAVDALYVSPWRIYLPVVSKYQRLPTLTYFDLNRVDQIASFTPRHVAVQIPPRSSKAQ